MSTSDKILDQLRGNYEAQAQSDRKTAEASAKARAEDERWVKERAAVLRENGVGMAAAHQRASGELRQRKLAEGEARDRAIVDEQLKSISERDRQATSADGLRDKLRQAAQRPADHAERVAKARQAKAIQAEVDNEG